MGWRPAARVLFAGMFLAMSGLSAFAVQPDEMLSDPVLEKRARDISAGLRCLVCQNQSIDDSDAPLAADLRHLVRERLKAHDTDQQVIDYIVARYGDFVLLKPPFTPATFLLWASPIIVLLTGLLLALRSRQKAQVPAADLTEEERAKLATILTDDQR